MTKKVVILGAKGRLGRAAVDAFTRAGWRVRALARSWANDDITPGVEAITGDATSPEVVRHAAQDCDVILNALNPPYSKWARELPRFTSAVLAGARANGASVMIPGNVYGYGETMPARLTRDTPYAPTTPLGRARVDMEQSYADAAGHGVRTIVVQAGDFIERKATGNWFDSHICGQIAKGRVIYPGPLDRMHAWAYLPDLASAMVMLADKRAELAPFERIGFRGFALNGQMLVAALEKAVGAQLKLGSMPWRMIKLLGIASPQMRAVAQLAYLWRVPHEIDGTRLAALLPQFQATGLETALADALAPAIGLKQA